MRSSHHIVNTSLFQRVAQILLYPVFPASCICLCRTTGPRPVQSIHSSGLNRSFVPPLAESVIFYLRSRTFLPEDSFSDFIVKPSLMKNKDFSPHPHFFTHSKTAHSSICLCIRSEFSWGFFVCSDSDKQCKPSASGGFFCVMTLVTVQRQKVNQIEYSCPLFLSFHSSPSLLLFVLPPCGCKQDYLGFVWDMSKPCSFKLNRFQNVLVSSLDFWQWSSM